MRDWFFWRRFLAPAIPKCPAQLADSRDVRWATQNRGGSRHKLSWSIRGMSVFWRSQLRWQSIKRPRGARERWCVCVCVCVCDLGNRPMGGLVGGRAGRISSNVQHSYWSLDTNKGRAKDDLVCVRTPSSPPAVLGSQWEVYGMEGLAAPFGTALYVWKVGPPAFCLSSVPSLPPTLHKAEWDLSYIWKTQTPPH